MNWIIIGSHRINMDRVVDYLDEGYQLSIWYARTPSIVEEISFIGDKESRSLALYKLDAHVGIRKKIERRK